MNEETYKLTEEASNEIAWRHKDAIVAATVVISDAALLSTDKLKAIKIAVEKALGEE